MAASSSGARTVTSRRRAPRAGAGIRSCRCHGPIRSRRPASRLVAGVLDVAPSLHAALAGGAEDAASSGCPGKPHAPLPSPELIRTESARRRAQAGTGLWPFEVTALR